MKRVFGKLRIEKSKENSGTILRDSNIPILKEKDYFIVDQEIDGDAPKQFIKAYFYKKNNGVRRNNPNTWIPYIAKTAEKWYPHESVIEFLINKIGLELGLLMNEVKLVKGNGQIRFLSKYFLSKNERLVHGAEICGEHLGDVAFAKEIADNKSKARELFTFEFIKQSIYSVYPENKDELLRNLIRLLTFDAIVGNNDRHFYNWGIIDYKKKSLKPVRFAPIYDSARGLFWNFSDDNLRKNFASKKHDNTKLNKYIVSAKPRVSIENNKEANHFELIEKIKNENKNYQSIISELISPEKEKKVIEMIKRDFSPFFIEERLELIIFTLIFRFNKLREL